MEKTIFKDILKVILKRLRKIKKKIELKVAPIITKEDLKRDLEELGICKGDIVFVHSSLKRLGYVEGGAQAVLEALIETVSTTGTIVVPTYHTAGGTMYSTCLEKDYIFDPRTASTHLGAIPLAALKFPNVQRSIHPTHSVSAIGHHAKYLTEAHQLAASTFGKDSPWERLVKLNGKVLGLGISLAPVTFYHMIEDLMLDEFPVPVRMSKTYFLKCIDWNGNLIRVPVNPLDPRFSKTRIEQAHRQDLRSYFWSEFKNIGLLKTGKVGRATSWLISSQSFLNHLVDMAKEGITIYSSPSDLGKRPVTIEEINKSKDK